MRYYELLYIVNPNLEDERVNGIIEEVGNEIQKHKVNIINHHVWGKKRLAYPVNNNKYGIYILLQFGAEQVEFIKEFERYLILSKSVIRHQVIKLEEEPKKVDSITIEDDDAEATKTDDGDIPEDDNDADIDNDKAVEPEEESKAEVPTDNEPAAEKEKEEKPSEEEKQEEGE